MKKSDIIYIPEKYGYYIDLNEDLELSDAFSESLKQIDAIDLETWKRIGTKAYAEGKWSIHKIIQHIIDWERIWCYRVVLFARQEGSIPVGHEENRMAEHSNADELPIEQLIGELRAVRLSSIAMFDSFNPRILQTNCKFHAYEMSVLAMGFNIIGHQLHHFKVIEERYLHLERP